MNDLVKILFTEMPSLNKLKKDAGIDVNVTQDQLSTDDKEMVDGINELIVPESKLSIDRKSKLTQNITKLYGIAWGQCIPILHEDVKGITKYTERSKKYNCVWLLENLKHAHLEPIDVIIHN